MKKILLLPVVVAALLAGGATRIVQDQCGPFTDVTPGFCPYILEIYYLGITVGTSATTFSPDDPLTRGQGAVFIAKGINQTLARSSRRAALGQWWTPSTFPWITGLATTPRFRSRFRRSPATGRTSGSSALPTSFGCVGVTEGSSRPGAPKILPERFWSPWAKSWSAEECSIPRRGLSR